MSKHVEPDPEQNEESHERLMLAFREYFKANQNWQARGSRLSGEKMRYWLAQIRIIAKERRGHIQQYRVWLDKDKAAKKANQKAQAGDQDNTN